ncbi:glycosyltransferase [Paenibacillus alkalitolerans]|uniref:glycosyltransferase n=1 Tax=Paenibacillus alkalitolerans TaxID=2799335 RepID=UPI0018F7197B|nr:glycosyltransferase [Paenibacillus alkalitolerans]
MLKYDHELKLSEENSPSIILRQISKNTRVLEFGPATGYMTRYMKESLGCYVACVEVDPGSAEVTSKYCDRMIIADLDEMHWRDELKGEKFDFLIFADVLEHLKNPWKVLEASVSLLNDNGQIVLSVPNIGHNAILMSLLQGKFEYKELGLLDETHLRFFTRGGLLQLIEFAGLVPVQLNATISMPELTEFNQSYVDFSKPVRDFLQKRKDGHVYQFVFTCKKQSDVNENDVPLDLIPTIENEVTSVALQLFWQHEGKFDEKYSITLPYEMKNDAVEFRVQLPSHYEGTLRIDPVNVASFIELDYPSLCGHDEKLLKKFTIDEMKFSDSVIRVQESESLKIIALDNDPQLFVHLSGDLGASYLKIKIRYSEETVYCLLNELQTQHEQLNEASMKISEGVMKISEMKLRQSEMQNKIEENELEKITLFSKIELLETNLNESKVDIHNLRTENQELAHAVEKLTERSSKLHVENYKLQEKLASRELSLNQSERQLQEKNELLNGVYSSFSWKITKPVRYLGKILRNPEAYARSMIDMLIRKRYELQLNPIAELEHVKTNEWKSIGSDPQFYLVGRYPIGWTKLQINISPIRTTQGNMRLYLDRGHSFNEADSYHMGYIGSKQTHYIYLDTDLVNLRFDPLESEGEFTINGVSLTKVSKAEIWINNSVNSVRRKLRKILSFARFAMEKANDWKAKRGRYPTLSEIPDLARKAIYKWRSNQRQVLNDQLKPPPGFELQQPLDTYEAWLEVNQWNERKAAIVSEKIAQMKNKPLLSIVMPVYNPPIEFLDKAIDSVLQQLYPNWELLVADDASTNPNVKTVLEKWARQDSRIKVKFLETNGNISVATNEAAEMASGEFIVLMDNDDVLTSDALAEVAFYLGENPVTDVLYSDDDKVDIKGRRFAPQFKPDWSPELLLSYMYFSHIFVIRTSIYREVGGLRKGFEGSQDYDLALRVTEKARHVGHIPKILYHWRVLPNSTASSGSAKPESFEAARKALQEAFDRRGIQATVYQPDWALKAGCGIFSHEFPDDGPSVAIIIPTKNQHSILKACIDSVAQTTYKNYKVYVIDNDSDDPDTLMYLASIQHRVLKISNPNGKFSYAYINNQAVKAVEEEFVLFLNNDTEVVNPRWLSQMVGYLSIEGVGAVGARLIFPDGRIQHAGITHGYYNGMAGPSFKLMPEWNNGYLSYAKVVRNTLAVTAACLLTPRHLFLNSSGFDEKHFAVAYNDVDYCYRLNEAGYRMVYCPDAELKHYEGYSRGFADNPAEGAAFRQKFGNTIDPYYNPNLSLDNEHFEIASKVVVTEDMPPIKSLMCAFNLNWEGAPYSQYEMTVHLKRNGIIEPIVYSPHDGPLRRAYEDQGITVEVFEHPLAGVSNLYAYEKAIGKFKERLNTWNIELVYGNTLQTFYAIEAAKLNNLPSIWNPRESEPWQTYFSNFGDDIAVRALNCFNYPYKIIFVANATKNGCLPLNVHYNFTTIHNGLDKKRLYKLMEKWPRSQAREHLDVKSDELMVLLLGTVCDRKGQLDLAKAVALLDKEQVSAIKCFIVGDRPSEYSNQLHAFRGSLPEIYQKKIIIVPETSDTALYYSAADIFVCSSRIESFPRVILEAMASGLPIITTPAFGITEQVQQNINGVFYQPGDVRALAQHLNSFITMPDYRQRLAVNSKHVLNLLNDYDSMANSYGKIFREAWLSGRSR